ncbi:E3 ubiquitin-protein ligase TRIM58-like [Eublepharis macularius]|uniref:E3 ubiquitin-protein ligase TRIM58-like n=1 Tax=Eublepharis macularius TaxID=481883 RepID=A0AA97KVU8_EUBMA|nr:E3 ubiquitin-protein ligase TRIM58-like [Eublepharis macularius]
MASIPPSINVDQEAKCPICLECMSDPVVLDCGHSFCRGCITSYCEKWEALGETLECPTCKAKIQKGNFRTNWQLKNLVGKIKLLSLNPQKDDLCVKHKEKLHLFCKEDKELMCWICKRSPQHKSHALLLLEEAAQEYKDQMCRSLEIVTNKRKTILAHKADTEKESQDLLEKIELERQTAVAGFRKLHQFLEEREQLLLAHMEEVEKEIARKRDEHLDKLSEELSSLKNLIWEIEEKCQQPAIELLQDIKNTLKSFEVKKTFENPVAFPPELKWKIGDFCHTNSFLEDFMKKFKGNVTLDPKTAHPQLILSQDLKSVRRGDKSQELPNNPERFDQFGIVLGLEGFASGRHFWEVRVESEEEWVVGVARKSVKRKGKVNVSPEGGIWAAGRWASEYKASIRSKNPLLSASGELKRIWVTLDYERGQVAFFDADLETHLYTFSAASFCGETLLPFFWVHGKAHLRLYP